MSHGAAVSLRDVCQCLVGTLLPLSCAAASGALEPQPRAAAGRGLFSAALFTVSNCSPVSLHLCPLSVLVQLVTVLLSVQWHPCVCRQGRQCVALCHGWPPCWGHCNRRGCSGEGQRTECLFQSCAKNIGKEQSSGKSSCFPGVLHGSESQDNL